MPSTREIADLLGCTVQSINKAVRKACDAYNIELSEFGQPDPTDRRIRIFSESEVEQILEFAPKPRVDSEPVETEVVTPSGMMVRTAQPLMGFGIQTLNINITVANTESLETEAQNLNGITAQAFNALKQITTSELKASVAEMRAQNRHAVAGIQASSVLELVQELGGTQTGGKSEERSPASHSSS